MRPMFLMGATEWWSESMPSNTYSTRRPGPQSLPSLTPVPEPSPSQDPVREVADAIVEMARAMTGLEASLSLYDSGLDAYLPRAGGPSHMEGASQADQFVLGLSGRHGEPLAQISFAGTEARSDPEMLEDLRAFSAVASGALENATRVEGQGESRADSNLPVAKEDHRGLEAQVQELQELNRLKDEFVANVSHELRTPLTAILGNIMTVAGLGEMLGSDERRELLRAAERQAKRLAELMENLLAESRLTGGKPRLTLSVVGLGQFLGEVADTLRFRTPDRAIKTHSRGRVDVLTDRTLLYRILFNLGDNAVKYSEGQVRFEARREPDGVRIDVVDEGPGIAPQDMTRIFQQFEQLDGSTSRRVGGVGLGLHLCAAATAALGGRISVVSAPGQGSTFSLWLPLRPPGQPD
jgi:signal transduction histidine kinase